MNIAAGDGSPSGLERVARALPDHMGACSNGCGFAPGQTERIAHFEPADRAVIRGRIFSYGPFPFNDQPSRNDVGLFGRKVLMNGKVYRIAGIERYSLPTPLMPGEPVGLLLEPRDNDATL